MNKVYLIGNLTKDPERSETNSGLAVCRFSIAVNRGYKTEDGEQITDFFNITAWRGQAENCGKYLSKGKKVAIVGSLQNRTYEDKEGVKRQVTDVIASEVEFLTPIGNTAQNESGKATEKSTKKDNGGTQQSIPGTQKKPELLPVADDDQLPF